MEDNKSIRLLWEIYDAVMEELTPDDKWRKYGGDWYNPLIWNTVLKAKERVENRLQELLCQHKGLGIYDERVDKDEE